MGLSVIIFAFMPYLDRSRIPGGARNRPIYKVQFYLFIADMLVLGFVGYYPPTNQSILIGQIATVCYFGSFLIVPFLSKVEERWLIKRNTALIKNESQQTSNQGDVR